METLDDVAAGLVHHAHSVVPGRRNRLVVLAGGQERPGYPVNLRHVVPPELDERPEALSPAGRRPVVAQTLVESQDRIPVTYGRNHQIRPGAEVVVYRLPRDTRRPGNVAHAHTLPVALLHQAPRRLEYACPGSRSLGFST
jgi:hypothetical protein